MKRPLARLGLLGVALLLLLLWQHPALADALLRRIELQPGERAELVCGDDAHLVITATGGSAAEVECLAHGAPAPPPGAGGHPAGCRAGEIFQDSQDWWTHDDPARNFGHLHTQLCFPVNARIDRPYPLTVTTLLHDNPGTFYRLMVQSFGGGLDRDEQRCGDSTAVICKSFERSMERCEATGGELIDHGATCRWRDSVTIDPAALGQSGWQQFRVRAFVAEPDGTRMATSTSLHAEIVNDRPPSNLYKDYGSYNYLRGRGWYTDAEYAAVYLIDAEQLKRPISGLWEPTVHFQPGPNHDGSPPADITGHFAALDTDFHAGRRGTVLLEGEGEYHGQLRVDTRTLANGWHRLFLRADQAMPDGHTHSGVLAVWFEVRN
jgi:hypothetical protein